MKKYLFLIVFSTLSLWTQEAMQEGVFVRQKQEILALKKELNEFYDKKELEYIDRKAELKQLIEIVKNQKKQIKKLFEQNKKIAQEINGKVQTKTTTIFNKMKPKISASIFNDMIEKGQEDDVFAIILRLKEKKVMQIMKYLGAKNASLITLKLQNYKTKE